MLGYDKDNLFVEEIKSESWKFFKKAQTIFHDSKKIQKKKETSSQKEDVNEDQKNFNKFFNNVPIHCTYNVPIHWQK